MNYGNTTKYRHFRKTTLYWVFSVAVLLHTLGLDWRLSVNQSPIGAIKLHTITTTLVKIHIIMNDFIQRNMHVFEGVSNYSLGTDVVMALTKGINNPGQWMNAYYNQLMAYVCRKGEY